MTGQRIGYKRVSTVDQNTGRQLEDIHIDKVFEDKASGKARLGLNCRPPSDSAESKTRWSCIAWTASRAT
jgi:hypothetical protein